MNSEQANGIMPSKHVAGSLCLHLSHRSEKTLHCHSLNITYTVIKYRKRSSHSNILCRSSTRSLTHCQSVCVLISSHLMEHGGISGPVSYE